MEAFGARRVEPGVADEAPEGAEAAVGILEPGRRLWVMNVRLVSTWASFTLIESQIVSIISSSLRKLTSRLVGWTFTSTRCGSMSRLR